MCQTLSIMILIGLLFFILNGLAQFVLLPILTQINTGSEDEVVLRTLFTTWVAWHYFQQNLFLPLHAVGITPKICKYYITVFPAYSDTLGTWEKCQCNQIVTVTRGSSVTNQSFGMCQKCHCKRGVTVNSVTVSGEICTFNMVQT